MSPSIASRRKRRRDALDDDPEPGRRDALPLVEVLWLMTSSLGGDGVMTQS
jgi:hypothetical protein